MPSLTLNVFFFLAALDHVGKFQELCGFTHLPALKNLYFSFCFPEELESAWRISSFGCNGEWPFDNIECYIDEYVTTDCGGEDCITETVFVVYKRPINILLQHKRTLHNHGFATQASVPIITTQRRSVEWTCDRIDASDQLVNTLRVVADGRVDALYLTFLAERVSLSSYNLNKNQI
jgi:hypothetical protein